MSTSKLQIQVGDLLDKTFPGLRIRENYKPEWLRSSDLKRLELDFYIEELKIAFEIQGEQHYRYVPFFHVSQDEFEKRKRYDQEKRDLCYGSGIKLIEIFTLTDAIVAIKEIASDTAMNTNYEVTKGEWKAGRPEVDYRKLYQKKVKTKRVYSNKCLSVQDTNTTGATQDQKNRERDGFRRKFKKHGTEMNFIFEYLDKNEQIELLREFGITC